MRSFIYLILLTVGCASCSHFQYLTISSPQTTTNDRKQLVYENDTLRLVYDFNGKNGPVSVNIYNKTSQPLYVNWKKSALIRNEHFISYFDRRVYFSGDGFTFASRSRLFSTASTSFNGSFELPEGLEFIPPGTSISKGLATLGDTGPMVAMIPDSIGQQSMKYINSYSYAKFRQIIFDETESPIQFKSYLTFVLGMNNSPEFAKTNDFYISEALDSKSPPEQFTPRYQQQGNMFFVKYQKQ
ncbi:MAG: hypothetical protein JST68_03675 [Bacteroidetes bacterium]|nr:hypothetical protein [Bacteroidota bacterium]